MRGVRSRGRPLLAILAGLAIQGCSLGVYVGEYGVSVGRCDVKQRRTVHTTSVTGHGHGKSVDEAKRMARLDAIAQIQDKDIRSYDMDCTSGTVTGPGFRERWSSGFRETYGGGGSSDSEEGYSAEMKFRVRYW